MLEIEKNKTKKQALMEKIEKFCSNVEKTFVEALDRDGVIGSVAEIYDTKAPYASKGAPAQGWSVSEIFRIILRK